MSCFLRSSQKQKGTFISFCCPYMPCVECLFEKMYFSYMNFSHFSLQFPFSYLSKSISCFLHMAKRSILACVEHHLFTNVIILQRHDDVRMHLFRPCLPNGMFPECQLNAKIPGVSFISLIFNISCLTFKRKIKTWKIQIITDKIIVQTFIINCISVLIFPFIFNAIIAVAVAATTTTLHIFHCIEIKFIYEQTNTNSIYLQNRCI